MQGETRTQTSITSLLQACFAANANGRELREDTLGLLNMAMAQRRALVHNAPSSRFHEYLGRLCESGNLVGCITANIDGMESKNYPGVEEKLHMMRGDNRLARCLMPDCPGLIYPLPDSLEEKSRNGESVPCVPCMARG